MGGHRAYLVYPDSLALTRRCADARGEHRCRTNARRQSGAFFVRWTRRSGRSAGEADRPATRSRASNRTRSFVRRPSAASQQLRAVGPTYDRRRDCSTSRQHRCVGCSTNCPSARSSTRPVAPAGGRPTSPAAARRHRRRPVPRYGGPGARQAPRRPLPARRAVPPAPRRHLGRRRRLRARPRTRRRSGRHDLRVRPRRPSGAGSPSTTSTRSW